MILTLKSDDNYTHHQHRTMSLMRLMHIFIIECMLCRQSIKIFLTPLSPEDSIQEEISALIDIKKIT